jgi:hypothetical protein
MSANATERHIYPQSTRGLVAEQYQDKFTDP